ncbi:hypothetical protein E2C01_030020 [Portunus trituberculatus]|uniref:Uncharacterized protein n=1 Tax=Portunus trituberculatus TaxID=210409 RepID=A0A5B7ETL3_PORTR|nr:hypothetical protein [Portunus trituberculatus]
MLQQIASHPPAQAPSNASDVYCSRVMTKATSAAAAAAVIVIPSSPLQEKELIVDAAGTPAPFSSLFSEWRNEGRFEGSGEGRLGRRVVFGRTARQATVVVATIAAWQQHGMGHNAVLVNTDEGRTSSPAPTMTSRNPCSHLHDSTERFLSHYYILPT